MANDLTAFISKAWKTPQGRKRTCLHGGPPGLDAVRHDLQGRERGAQAPEGLLAVVQVEGVDTVELGGGVVGVAPRQLRVVAVLLVGLEAQGVGLAVDGLADLPRVHCIKYELGGLMFELRINGLRR